MFRIATHLPILVLVAALAACESSSSDTGGTTGVDATNDLLGDAGSGSGDSTGGSDVSTTETVVGDTVASDTGGECTFTEPAYDGAAWMLGAQIAPVGCVKLSFVLEVKGEFAAGKTLEWVRLRSVTKCGVSDSLMQLDNVAVASDGKAELVFKGLMIPKAYSPTGSDLKIDLTMSGSLKSADLFCGTLGGYLDLFKKDLAGSEFAAQPKAVATTPLKSSCSGAGCPVALQHIDPAKCPAMALAGDATITSAGLARGYKLFLPKESDTVKPKALVFLWHGIGDSPAKILEQTAFNTLVDTGGFILIVPQGRDTKDVPTQWSYVSDAESEDSFLFDDLLTCASKAHAIDAKRVYAIGFSGGGMWTSWLSSFRADKLAGTAIFSGGLIDSVTYPKPAHKLPSIVVQGGPNDKAFQTDLGLLAKALVQTFVGNGNFVISCEHTLGHKFPPEMSPAAWKFFSDVTLDTTGSVYTEALPQVFPTYCAVAKPPE